MKGACNRTVAIGQRRSLKPGLKGRDVAGFARNLPPLGLDILKPGVLILFQLSNHPPPSLQNLIHPEIRLRGVKSRLVLKQFLGVFRGVYTRNITFSPSGSVSDGHVPTARRRPTLSRCNAHVLLFSSHPERGSRNEVLLPAGAQLPQLRPSV